MTELKDVTNATKLLTDSNFCEYLGILATNYVVITTAGITSAYVLGSMPSSEEPLTDLACANLANETICAGTDSCEWYGCDGTLDCSGYSSACGGGECVNPQHTDLCEQYFSACMGEITCDEACPFQGEDFRSCCIAHSETCIYTPKCGGIVDCSPLDQTECQHMGEVCYWDNGVCYNNGTPECEWIGDSYSCLLVCDGWQEAATCSGIASCGNEFPGETECCQASQFLPCSASYYCVNKYEAACSDLTLENACINYYGCAWSSEIGNCTGTLNAYGC